MRDSTGWDLDGFKPWDSTGWDVDEIQLTFSAFETISASTAFFNLSTSYSTNIKGRQLKIANAFGFIFFSYFDLGFTAHKDYFTHSEKSQS